MARARQRETGGLKGIGMIRVLLVGQHAQFARTFRRRLSTRHEPVRMRPDDCRSARAALTRLAARKYEVVVVDPPLSDMDGLKLG